MFPICQDFYMWIWELGMLCSAMRSGALQRLELKSKNETETWRGAEMRDGRDAGLALLPLPGLCALSLSLFCALWDISVF